MDASHQPRKAIRLKGFDYSSAGAYFITVCIKDRRPILWKNVGAAISRPDQVPLSAIGQIVDTAIAQIPDHYSNIRLDKYCIMPDHIHLILFIDADENGQQIAAPTISNVIGQMKRWASKQAGYSIWQKSFIDRVIRNEQGYLAVWEYIDNNPIKMDTANDFPDFSFV